MSKSEAVLVTTGKYSSKKIAALIICRSVWLKLNLMAC